MLLSELLLSFGAALAVPAPGPAPPAPFSVQEPQEGVVDERQVLARSMKTVRDRRLTLDNKAPAFESLLGLSINGPRALAAHLERELATRAKRRVKDEGALLDGVARRATRLLAARTTRERQAIIDADRSEVLALARNAGLSKGAIQSRSDPALARLREALSVTMGQVWDADEDLFEDYVTLLDSAAEDALLFEYWLDCRRVLEALDAQAELKRLDQPADPRGADDALVAAIKLRAAAATPMTAADRRAFEKNAALEGLDAEERSGVLDLNWTRILLGLNALVIDTRLSDAARDHSKDMVELGFFAHSSPVVGKESPWKRAANFGTSAGSENIAAGAATGPGANRQWWYSPGHHRNMLGGARRIGLGRHERTWTQMFGG